MESESGPGNIGAAFKAMEEVFPLFPNNPNLIYETSVRKFASKNFGLVPLTKKQVIEWARKRRQWHNETVQNSLERLVSIHGDSANKLFEESRIEYFRNGKIFPLSKERVADWISTRTKGSQGSS